MSEISKKLKIESPFGFWECCLYDDLNDLGDLHYLTVELDHSPCYLPLTEEEGEYTTPMRVEKDFRSYRVLREMASSALVLTDSYYKMMNIYPDEYTRMSAVPDELNTSQLTTTQQMFFMCYGLKEVPQMDTSNVRSMEQMFNVCVGLETIPPMNTSNVTMMSSMFNACESLKSIPELDTHKVYTFSGMFSGCKNLTSVPQMDTSNASVMTYMFYGCKALERIEGTLDFSKITSTSSVTDMFYNCLKLTEVRVKNIDKDILKYLRDTYPNINFITEKVEKETVTLPLNGQYKMRLIYSNDYQNMTECPANYDTSSLSSMSEMFMNCAALTEVPTPLDTSGFDGTVKNSSMRQMFSNCSSLVTVPYFDTSLNCNFQGMFEYCTSLIEVPEYDTSRATKMIDMFKGCTNLTTIGTLDFKNINRSTNNGRFTNIEGMFDGCTSLQNVDLRNISDDMLRQLMGDYPDIHFTLNGSEISFGDTLILTDDNYKIRLIYPNDYQTMTYVPDTLDTSRLTTMQGLYAQCSSLQQVQKVDTSNITNMLSLYSDCNALRNVPTINTSNVTNMKYMFSKCSSLTTIPAMDTSKVTDMYGMFEYCSNLTTINGVLDFSSITSSSNVSFMFTSCPNLQEVRVKNISNLILNTLRNNFSGINFIVVE